MCALTSALNRKLRTKRFIGFIIVCANHSSSCTHAPQGWCSALDEIPLLEDSSKIDSARDSRCRISSYMLKTV
jgi:hypothetical protein